MAFINGVTHIYCVFIVLSLSNSNYVFSAAVKVDCPKPGPTVEYKGSEIYLSQVKACSSVNRQASLIVVKSFNNTYIDDDFSNLGNSVIHPSILLISPNLLVKGKQKFDLNGVQGTSPLSKPSGKGTTKGIPGVPGGTAGSFIVAYQNRVDNNNGDISFQLIGGDGGPGQDGQNANNGANGAGKTMKQRDDYYCSAWRRGWVKVWITPNRCLEGMDSNGRCKANNSGARWLVYGTYGQVGGNGNDGGAGGIAGNGGYGVVADMLKSVNKTYAGTKGKAGNGGQPGAPGKGGKKGDTLHVTIDDANGPRGKWCKFVSGPYFESVNIFARDGVPGNVGGNRVGAKQPRLPFTLNQFRPHIQSYVNDCSDTAAELEDFKLLKFCTRVRAYFQI